MQEFGSTRLMPNESMDDFLNRFKGITDNLQSLEKVIKCFDMNNKVLRSQPMEYNSINPIEIYKDIYKNVIPRIDGNTKECENQDDSLKEKRARRSNARKEKECCSQRNTRRLFNRR